MNGFLLTQLTLSWTDGRCASGQSYPSSNIYKGIFNDWSPLLASRKPMYQSDAALSYRMDRFSHDHFRWWDSRGLNEHFGAATRLGEAVAFVGRFAHWCFVCSCPVSVDVKHVEPNLIHVQSVGLHVQENWPWYQYYRLLAVLTLPVLVYQWFHLAHVKAPGNEEEQISATLRIGLIMKYPAVLISMSSFFLSVGRLSKWV